MQRTIDAGVAAVLARLLSHLREILGGRLGGVYLYGSVVAGDFDPAISDIDLLVVTASALTEDEFRALDRMHGEIIREHPEWDDRLDIDYVSAGALQTFRTEYQNIAVITPGEPFHRLLAGRDWLMNWYLVLQQSLTLHGPAPSAFIPPISTEEFVQATRDHAIASAQWAPKRGLRKQQGYTILTLCRALYTREHYTQPSKRQAAIWAASAYPEWASLIEDALVWREAWRDDDVDHVATFPETMRFLEFAIQRVAEGKAGST